MIKNAGEKKQEKANDNERKEETRGRKTTDGGDGSKGGEIQI